LIAKNKTDQFFGAGTIVEGLLLVLRLFGTNSLLTNSSLRQKLLEFSTFNTSGGANILLWCFEVGIPGV